MDTKILVIGTGNSVRSQMAEGILFSLNPELEVYSAGTDPDDKINPLTIDVMDEIGIDISRHIPKSVDDFLDQSFDYAITVCDNAKETDIPFTGNIREKFHISIEDPTETKGSEEEKLKAFRQAREEIRERLGEFFHNINDHDQYRVK